jgi:hypothetical protein
MHIGTTQAYKYNNIMEISYQTRSGQVYERTPHARLRTGTHLLGHQFPNIYGRCVRQNIIREIEIHDSTLPTQRQREQRHAMAVGGLARTGRTDDELPKQNHLCIRFVCGCPWVCYVCVCVCVCGLNK